MKTIIKTFLLCSIFTFSMTNANAQTPFTTDSHVVHAGFGLGGYGFGLSSCYSSTPIISVAYDQGIIDDLGIGNLGVGGAIGIKRYNYDCAGFDYNFTRVFIGARAHYHFHFVNSDKLDFYAGVMAGAFFWLDSDGDTGDNYTTDVSPGAFAGVNYFFTPSFGVYGEVGYGLGFLNGGVAFNF